jgi:hypothetical protein
MACLSLAIVARSGSFSALAFSITALLKLPAASAGVFERSSFWRSLASLSQAPSLPSIVTLYDSAFPFVSRTYAMTLSIVANHRPRLSPLLTTSSSVIPPEGSTHIATGSEPVAIASLQALAGPSSAGTHTSSPPPATAQMRPKGSYVSPDDKQPGTNVPAAATTIAAVNPVPNRILFLLERSGPNIHASERRRKKPFAARMLSGRAISKRSGAFECSTRAENTRPSGDSSIPTTTFTAGRFGSGRQRDAHPARARRRLRPGGGGRMFPATQGRARREAQWAMS